MLAWTPDGGDPNRKVKLMAEKKEAGGEKRRGTGRGIQVAAVSLAMVVAGSGAALAATLHGTNAGDFLSGTARADTVHAYGGADLVYGLGGRDTVWGGNEAGFGDKVRGGAAADRLTGQMGDDALYGGYGNDGVYGQRGGDLLVGGGGEDTLNAGPGADKVDARDGRRDRIELWDSGPGDVVYYDRGTDVLLTKPAEPAGEDARRSAGVSAAEAARATGAELRAEEPPEGLFAHTGKVLVEHENEEVVVAEDDVEAHLRPGDEILDPTGRSVAGEGRR